MQEENKNIQYDINAKEYLSQRIKESDPKYIRGKNIVLSIAFSNLGITFVSTIIRFDFWSLIVNLLLIYLLLSYTAWSRYIYSFSQLIGAMVLFGYIDPPTTFFRTVGSVTNIILLFYSLICFVLLLTNKDINVYTSTKKQKRTHG